ncbi:MAG TPA: aminotransferase class V-fold PLP-dependent enzyme [Candidatus Scatomorpha pullicola]|nr:aminotransferase class V-fold PLP-dependent enzyme [Candidatus Scatomorpha pullicola]
MIRFESDYLEGALPEVMQALCDTNYAQTPGYGEDEYCREAADMIRAKCSAPDADVHFLVGGTQANMIVITAALRPHQAAIAAETGHIAVHETGSIEAAGHKVITLKSGDGKITAAQVRSCVEAHWNDSTHEHMAQPALVYISQPTENGTVYSLAELEALSAVCREKGLLFYVDGARLGTALVSSDMALPDLARLTDAFYIGGTKLGALFGEAVVITNRAIARDFRYIVKQRGGMFAKGRLLGVQFGALMHDGLYERTAKREVDLAMKLRAAFEAKGWPLCYDSPTNQQFPIVPDAVLEKLAEKYTFSHWGKVDGSHTAVRFCTSWATREEDVDALIADIESL